MEDILNLLSRVIRDDAGVSPVIGVIMMVAIVVLLAAVVAAFTFGVITIPATTPTASLSIEKAEVTNAGNGNSVELTLLHEGGESLDVDKTELVLTDINSTETKVLNLSAFNKDIVEWSTGQRITGNIGDFDEKNLKVGDFLEVRVVDVDSGGVIGVLTSVLT
ncbi:MAG: type IV pilin [Methanonatronarchaeia archaeon]|nr:MAG: type IV pilin [Methanonatronarchaeia archaeon]